MESAVIVHGKPLKEVYENHNVPKPHEANWLPWLGEELEKIGREVFIPVLPRPYFPVYRTWKETLESAPFPINRNTLLIGHSAGAELLNRWLSENPDVEAEKLVLVAPYKDWSNKYDGFSDYTPDRKLPDRIGQIIIFNSLDDDAPIKRRAQELAAIFPKAQLVEFKKHGHFKIGHNMTSREFPELLEAVRQ